MNRKETMANNLFIELLPPWVETGLQPAFYDKESGTVLQQTARMYTKVNETVAGFDQLNDIVNDYVEQFNELHDYVHDYFDNLDVQQEINNKLDAMVADGSFQPLLDTTFSQYFNYMKSYTDNALDGKVDKNGTGQVTYNNLSQSVKEMFTGGNTPVVGINSVGTDNIIDDTVSYQKLNDNGKNGVAGFNQKKIIGLNWEQGTRHVDSEGALTPSNNTIVTTEPISISVGMRITTKSGYKAAVYSYTSGSRYYMQQNAFISFDYVIGSDFPVDHKNDEFYISIRRTDDANLTPSEGFDSIIITELQSNVKPSYFSFDNDTQKVIMGESPALHINDTYSLGNPVWRVGTDFYFYNGPIINGMNRAFLNTPVFLPAGTILNSTDDWEFVIIEEATRWIPNKVYYPSNGWTDNYIVEEGGSYYIGYRKSDGSGLGDIADQFIGKFTVTLSNAASANKTLYVSGTGSDESGNGSWNHPYREITKAISEGANTVVCEGGYKYSPLNYTRVSNLRIVGEFPTYSAPSNVVQSKPYFDASEILTGNTEDDGKVKIPYIAEQGSDMYACLVAKTKGLKDSSSERSDGYYVTIYSDGDKDTSHRYIPVLEEDSVAGHFYYDGSYIYINPYSDNNVNNEYSLLDSNASDFWQLVVLTNCHNITFENFCFKHSGGSLFLADKCSGIKVVNCDFCGSSRGDNLAALNSNIDITNCVSYLARNDGYNFHGFGESIVTKCIGCHCFDDGISHHDQCNHTINGGEYYDNNKGGISSPTYGCSSDIIGCYVHDNTNGIYTASNSSHGTSYINLSNNLITRNATGVLLSGCEGVAFNNIVANNNTNIVNNSSVVVY